MIGNINIINKRVATKLGLPDKKIKEINETYFKFLRRTLTNGTAVNYYVRDLGTFSVDLSSIRREIHKLLGTIKGIRQRRKILVPSQIEEKFIKEFKTLWKQYDVFRHQIIKQKIQYEKNRILWGLEKAPNNTEGIHTSTVQEEPTIIRDEI